MQSAFTRPFQIGGQPAGHFNTDRRLAFKKTFNGFHRQTEAERAARKSCKPAFEKLWKTGAAPMSRNAAYAWLAEALQIPLENCHLAMFGVERCELAKKLCKAKYRELVGSKEER